MDSEPTSEPNRPLIAIGLMSGTSLDGIDAALIETDGVEVYNTGPWLTLLFDNEFRDELRALMNGQGDAAALERELTLRHAKAVRQLINNAGLSYGDVDLIGFHGQTILHNPAEGKTWQIGDGDLLAAETGISVVNDFRSNDVANGGQGAPLVPLYHAALAAKMPKPVAILNLGGVGNVTWLGANGEILAFDTGPGNALINDAVHAATGEACDVDGELALAGKADMAWVKAQLATPYFSAKPPKSLDRNHFSAPLPKGMNINDAAATLTEFTAAAIHAALAHMPAPPGAWAVCGGGRHNPAMMEALKRKLGTVFPVDVFEWDGDALEAQAFGFLAVRSVYGLPLSLPTTTGVSRAVTGGVFYPGARDASR